MARSIELNAGRLKLVEEEIDGFLEKTVTAFGNSGKADVPKRYIGRRAYVIIVKELKYISHWNIALFR